ncbi:MAG: outer membrane lipoprotein LolB [Proteobacteria bacterium]|nr:outer membrane lipoprotein LolB [Pseudomonadota bacterium]
MSANVVSRTLINSARPIAATVVLATLLSAGCASRQSVQLPDIELWDTRVQVLGNHDNWEFSGRIGVSANNDGFNGKLRWAQKSDAFSATISGPLGIGTVRIEGDGESVVFTDKAGVRTELGDVEIELQVRYGWTIPVMSLRYWALGIPDPTARAQTEFNAHGQLVKIMQRDWTVTISSYRNGGGQAMPRRLSASNADTRVRIVIDKWLFFD